jgi:hypothetical protein
MLFHNMHDSRETAKVFCKNLLARAAGIIHISAMSAGRVTVFSASLILRIASIRVSS